jgi:hypothetical protein
MVGFEVSPEGLKPTLLISAFDPRMRGQDPTNLNFS